RCTPLASSLFSEIPPQPEIPVRKIEQNQNIQGSKLPAPGPQIFPEGLKKIVTKVHKNCVAQNRTKPWALRISIYAKFPPTIVRFKDRTRGVMPQMRGNRCRGVKKLTPVFAQPPTDVRVFPIRAHGFVVTANGQ